MVEPLSPGAVSFVVPDVVLTVFNELIEENWTGDEAVVMREDALQKIIIATNLSRAQVYEKHLLDIEDEYRRAGWKVNHQQPERGESFLPFYRFTK